MASDEIAMNVETPDESRVGPSVVVEHPTVHFADGRWAEFSRVTVLSGGALSAELTRNIVAEFPESKPVLVTDTVIYGPATWSSVYTAPRGVLTAWTWRRDDRGVIQQEPHVVATGITEGESREHAVTWLRKYAIADSQLGEIADIAFSQRITVSDPETIALKFYFVLP